MLQMNDCVEADLDAILREAKGMAQFVPRYVPGPFALGGLLALLERDIPALCAEIRHLREPVKRDYE